MAKRSDDMRSYGGQAAVYDREYQCYYLDARLYQDRLRFHRIRGPILELGVGTGRVALLLAAAGYDVTGIDLSSSMLRQARRSARLLAPDIAARLHFRKADMTTFRLPTRFAAILIPFSTFNLVTDPAARAACLARCHEHLVEGGFLWMDAPIPPPSGLSGVLPERRFVSTIPLSQYGREMRKETFDRPDVGRGIDDITYRYSEVRILDGVVLRTYDVVFSMVRLSPDQVQDEVAAAGFDVMECFGDYMGTPFGPDADRLVVEAVRR
jgi:SAM-dependent methyltransferase